ncbi:MAG: M48 family metalloprotease [Flavobacteriaceae bacterium]
MRRGGGLKIRLLIGAGIILFSLFKYWGSAKTNKYTGRKQHITITTDQEIRMGLSSAPAMAQQHGGLYPDQSAQDLVDKVGQKLVNNSIAQETGYRFDFHLLRDPKAINAFALPGGQCFITYALFAQLENEDQLAGVLGHEIAHVVGRHSADRMSKQKLTQGILSGVSVGGGANAGQMAAQIANMVNMKYGREDELESDDLGVKFMLDAGYQPEEMLGVMKILKASSGGRKVPEFQSTHPDPENRMAKIKAAIRKYRGTSRR